jgi:hypothetical protein
MAYVSGQQYSTATKINKLYAIMILKWSKACFDHSNIVGFHNIEIIMVKKKTAVYIPSH